MKKLGNYQIVELIQEGIVTVVYRGISEQNHQPVIIKILKSDYPELKIIAKLKHEYKILKKLNIAGVVKAFKLEKYNNKWALILEDFGGISLKSSINKHKLNLVDCLRIAIKISTNLGEIHQNKIIHKDIKPSNIIFNPKTEEVKITDFGIASLLSLEHQSIISPNLLEGTLAYISPEQTGRVNRPIDYRTDFYSLGITLYEMLTGVLPFSATDPMELIHYHIAKIPIPPHEYNPKIPKPLSDIVVKLLAKTAEDRYQTTLGITLDLERCLHQLETEGKISSFIIAQQDLSSRFKISQKLYGREAEVAALMAAFERVNQGQTEMVLVTGYSGIGKSSLVYEIDKPIVERKGFFVSGKFDQLQRNVPYASLIQAFQELLRQILTESQEKVEMWRKKLLEALGNNGQVIIDVIPEVELIIGKQPSVPQLNPAESQNRFNLVFQKFIGVFTKAEHPLVLFLDDLQWADLASLKFIFMLMTASDTQYLLLIGAYRDNEVNPSHPLMLTVDEIKQGGAALQTIVVKPLALDNINQLIADSLYCELETAKPLAELCFQKTFGNPFFLNQFLKSLYTEGLLKFNPSSGSWQWDLQEIQDTEFADNVVDLMISKLQKLDNKTQNLLKLAACIGNRFNLEVLSVVYKKSYSLTASHLWEALTEGLILPLNNTYKIPLVFESVSQVLNENNLTVEYKFLHDRVQQAAYSLIRESDKQKTHLKIGKLLLKNTPEQELEEKVFDLVKHLNVGAELIDDPELSYTLSNLNLMAGKKAKDSTAYEAALKYFSKGIEVLPGNIWQDYYEIVFILYREWSECEYLCGNFEKAEELFDLILNHARTNLEKAEIQKIRLVLYDNTGKYLENLKIGSQALASFGLTIPTEQQAILAALELELETYRNNLRKIPVAELINAPEMTNPEIKACMNLLMYMSGPAYFTNQDLLSLISLKEVNLSIEYGNGEVSAHGYAWVGIIAGSRLNDYETGYELGKLALKLNEKFNKSNLTCKVYNLFGANISPWRSAISNSIPILREGYLAGVEIGDVYTSYNSYNLIMQRILVGDNFASIIEESNKHLNVLEKMKNTVFVKIQELDQHFLLNLQGLTPNKFSFSDDSFNENECIKMWKKNYFMPGIATFNIFKSQILFLYGDYKTALKIARASEKTVDFLLGIANQAEHYFYYSLILTALYPKAAEAEKSLYDKILKNHLEKFKLWANNCPDNFLHKYLLIQAEMARIEGKDLEALNFYDQAIESASLYEFKQNQALANELAALFWLKKGKEKMAKIYLREAHYGYKLWGANRKVEELETQYSHLLVEAISTKTKLDKTLSQESSSTGTSSDVLDMTTVIKASQALAEEIILNLLIKKLMAITIENAGAQTGFLIFNKEGQLLIEAKGTVDSHEVIVDQSNPLESRQQLPMSVINYVARTREDVVLNNATREGIFTTDPYIINHHSKSILCTPIIHQGELIGLLYLENNLTTGAFTPTRLEILKVLSSQAAISLKNAQLYETMMNLNVNLKREIKERQKADEALRESERKMAQFLEAVPIGIFVIDANGHPYYANQTAQQLLGKEIIFSAKATELPNFYQAYLAGTDQLYPSEQQPIIRALKGETMTIDNLEIRQKDKTIPLEVSATPIFDEKGEIIYAIAAFADITQRKRAEAERIQFTQELAQKNIALQQAKDNLAESNRTLEYKVEERTRELSQTLEILKATQAELLFENALLRNEADIATYDYQVGGSLPMDAPTYVVRSADRYLYKALKRGEFCYILNARQMGKSSLMVHMMHYLQKEGIYCAAVDMTRIGSENVTPDQWYKGLAVEMARSVDLLTKVNLKTWWNERLDLSPVQRLSRFIEEVLLTFGGVEDGGAKKPLVIFFDEIDSVLSLNFSANDFFALIRSCYNQRSLNAAYQRLTFALFGVATPSDLITDLQRTPFNIGRAIQLEGFKEHEAQPLLQGLTEKVNNPQLVLKEILSWTNGQPFLTQKLCQLIHNSSSPITPDNEIEWIDNLVQTHVLTNWESQDEPEHLRTIKDRLLNSLQSFELLKLYQQVLHQGEVALNDSPQERELLLSGLVVKQQGFLRIHNRIYASIFNSDWVARLC